MPARSRSNGIVSLCLCCGVSTVLGALTDEDDGRNEPEHGAYVASFERRRPAVANVRRLERNSFRLNRYCALDLWWSMIFSENRCPLFRIML
jgi:hypothetical protein